MLTGFVTESSHFEILEVLYGCVLANYAAVGTLELCRDVCGGSGRRGLLYPPTFVSAGPQASVSVGDFVTV